MIDTTPIGIRALIQGGETQLVEFKRNLVSGSILQRIFAQFLNRVEGEGVVLFGVSDKGDIIGVSPDAASAAPDLIRRGLAPVLGSNRLLVDSVQLDGKIVVYAALKDAGVTPEHVQARYRSVRWGQFFLQLFCFYAILSAAWWLGRSLTIVRRGFFSFLYAYNLGASLENLLVLLIGLTALFALLFNGSSYRLLPLDIVGAPWKTYLELFRHYLKTAASSDELPQQSPPSSPVLGASNPSEQPPREEPEAEPSTVPATGQEFTLEFLTPEAMTPVPPPNIDDLLESMTARSTALADRFEKKTSTYMYMGVGLGILGLCIWFWRTAPNPGSAVPVTSTREQLYAFIGSILPRVTILLFVELLAGFFLRQYRIGMEDFRYFFETESKARLRSVAYAILVKNAEKDPLREFAADLYQRDVSASLKEGETTTTLEALKSEKNMTLETIHIFSEALKQVAAKGKVKDK